jgi:hypothetical protein
MLISCRVCNKIQGTRNMRVLSHSVGFLVLLGTMCGTSAFSPAFTGRGSTTGLAGGMRGAAGMCMGGGGERGEAADAAAGHSGRQGVIIGDGSLASRRAALRSGLSVAAGAFAVALGAPDEAAAKKPKKDEVVLDKDGKPYPTMSLKDFYTALYEQRVQKVEFEGAMYEVSSSSLPCMPDEVCECLFGASASGMTRQGGSIDRGHVNQNEPT